MSKVYSAKEKAAYAKKMQAARSSKKGYTKKTTYKKRSAPVARISRKLNIEDDVQKYILQVLNPYEGLGVGIPSSFPLKSQKVYAFVKGTFELGTSGVGFVKQQLYASNDNFGTYYTQATSVGTSATTLGAFTNLGSTAMAKLPYSSTNFNAGACQARIVAAGLRCRYIGRSDGLNGLVRSIEPPDNNDLDADTPVEVSNYDMQTTQRPSENDWTCVNYSGPIAPSDIEFSDSPFPLGTDGPTLAHVVEGTAGDQYAWEFHLNVEYIGIATVGKTQNISDPIGYAKVCQTLKSISSEKSLSPKLTHMAITKFARHVGESLPEFNGNEGMGIMNMDPGSPLRQALKIYPACI